MQAHGEWLLLPQRLALHEPTGIAVVADLHLGYSEARRHQGDAVPLPSVAIALAPLAHAAALHTLSGLIIAGDLFERGFDAKLYGQFLELLQGLKLPLLGIVPGNHDRGACAAIDASLLRPEGYRIGGWHICHGDEPASHPRVVQGHLHPAFLLRGRKYPSFAIGPGRLVLPAFSMDAAGTTWRHRPGWRCVAIVGEALHEVRRAQGRPSLGFQKRR